MTLVDVDLQQLRRELVSETGIRIDEDDPVLLAATISARITTRIIAAEREKRADENLLTHKDVRHVLMEVRDDAIHASEDLAAVAVTRVAEKVIEQVASADVKYAAAFYFAKASVLFGTGMGLGLLAGWIAL